MDAGTYNLKAKFDEDSNYLSSENTLILKVPKTATVLETSDYLTTKKQSPLKLNFIATGKPNERKNNQILC